MHGCTVTGVSRFPEKLTLFQNKLTLPSHESTVLCALALKLETDSEKRHGTGMCSKHDE